MGRQLPCLFLLLLLGLHLCCLVKILNRFAVPLYACLSRRRSCSTRGLFQAALMQRWDTYPDCSFVSLIPASFPLTPDVPLDQSPEEEAEEEEKDSRPVLAEVLGDVIWKEMSDCLIRDCLVHSIPNNSSKLGQYSEVDTLWNWRKLIFLGGGGGQLARVPCCWHLENCPAACLADSCCSDFTPVSFGSCNRRLLKCFQDKSQSKEQHRGSFSFLESCLTLL